MFRYGACSIYEHRPRTCRAYDCRVLAVAGVDPGPETAAIARRVERWRINLDSDEQALLSVRAAATQLSEHGEERWAALPHPPNAPLGQSAKRSDPSDVTYVADPGASIPKYATSSSRYIAVRVSMPLRQPWRDSWAILPPSSVGPDNVGWVHQGSKPCLRG